MVDKRGQTDGAALFSILPRARNRSLLRLLVAYQIIWDFLDSVNEQRPASGIANGHQLHLALIDALDPGRPMCDYYRHHPWREDGGYLRRARHRLPAMLRASCPHTRVFAPSCWRRPRAPGRCWPHNHELDPDRRDAALRAWARDEFPQGHEAGWFELSGAASAGLTIYALLALAAEPACGEAEIDRTRRAYFPWVSSAGDDARQLRRPGRGPPQPAITSTSPTT